MNSLGEHEAVAQEPLERAEIQIEAVQMEVLDEVTEMAGGPGAPAVTVVNGMCAAWEVVRDNVPVVSAVYDQAHALPAGADWSRDLTQGGGPNHLTFAFRAYHPSGVLAAAVHMRLYWVFGARYRDGGAFIPNTWLDVLACEAAPGNTVDIDLTVHEPQNWGTAAAPNAYLPISIRCADATQASAIEETRVFALYGTGHYAEYSG